MAKKDKDKEEGKSKGIPLAGDGSVSGVGSVSATDRVAQVRAVQAMSPFAAAASGIKVDIGKDFQLSREPFEARTDALRGMSNIKKHAKEEDKGKIFGQHVEGLTFSDKGIEKDQHQFFGDVNTKMFSAGEVLRRQGGFYVDSERFKPPTKGTLE